MGENHTIFGLSAMVGVSVNIFLKRAELKRAQLFYKGVDWRATRVEKFQFLMTNPSWGKMPWEELRPDAHHTWLIPQNTKEYGEFVSIGAKNTKSERHEQAETVFWTYSLGVSTNRDRVVYGHDRRQLRQRVQDFADHFNAEIDRYARKGKVADLDSFLDYSKTELLPAEAGRLEENVGYGLKSFAHDLVIQKLSPLSSDSAPYFMS